MGRDKALLLHVCGATLIENAVTTLRAARLHEIAISVSTVARADTLRAALPMLATLPFVVDLAPGCGPLGGLHAALCAYPGRGALLVACDMPRLDAPALRALLTAVRDSDVVAPRAAGYDQPLHAYYGPACRTVAARLLDDGERSMRALLAAPSLRVRMLDEAWLAHHGIPTDVFDNLNTPDDVAAAGHA